VSATLAANAATNQSFAAIQISGHKVVELRIDSNTLKISPGAEAPHGLELDELMLGQSRLGVSRRSFRWTGYLLEEHSLDVGEREEFVPPYASLFMWRRARSSGEIKVDGGRFVPYTKYPGFLSPLSGRPLPSCPYLHAQRVSGVRNST